MRLRPVVTDAGSRLTGIVAVSAAAILVACGSQLSDDEATAVAALGGGPTPSIEGASMFRGGPSRDGVYHVDGPPKTATQAWTFEAVGDAYSSPAVAKGVVYFGGIDETRTSGPARTATSGSTTGRAAVAAARYWPSISIRARRSGKRGCPAAGSTRR